MPSPCMQHQVTRCASLEKKNIFIYSRPYLEQHLGQVDHSLPSPLQIARQQRTLQAHLLRAQLPIIARPSQQVEQS
jgi:hypothetical protein